MSTPNGFPGPRGAPRLAEVLRTVYIVAHTEDTSALRRAFAAEGFSCEEVRGPYTEVQRSYPAQIRCLVNHANAWRRVADGGGLCLVVEADFVPVVGLARLPLPFVPTPGIKAMAWLYAIGPVLYHLDERGGMFGHTAGMVAYVLDATVASEMLAVFEQEMASPEPGRYRLWDVSLPIELRRRRGVRCYFPFRMYGEHGGLTNREHRAHGWRGWHQADVLAGRLHFLPPYARSSRLRFRVVRAIAHLRGWYRFLAGKNFDGWRVLARSPADRGDRFALAFRRLATVLPWKTPP